MIPVADNFVVINNAKGMQLQNLAVVAACFLHAGYL